MTEESQIPSPVEQLQRGRNVTTGEAVEREMDLKRSVTNVTGYAAMLGKHACKYETEMLVKMKNVPPH